MVSTVVIRMGKYGRKVVITLVAESAKRKVSFVTKRGGGSAVPDTFAPKALVDTLEQRLLFSAEHPLGMSLGSNDDSVDEMHRADANFISEALEELRDQQRKDQSSDLPLNDGSGVDDVFVVLHVTTTEDILDAPDRSSFEAIIMNPGNDGAISLREAIDVANVDSSIDVIRLDAETYRLTLTGGDRREDGNQEGDLDLYAPDDSQYIIQGVSQTDTIIEQTVGLERVAEHIDGRVIITDLTIRKGSVDNAGGGLLALDDANTYIENVLFDQNTSTGLGGAIDTQGTTILNNVTLSNNDADIGGGISIRENASVVIIDSTISDNESQSFGGGVSVIDQAELTLLDSTVEGNSSNISGGGVSISEQATATISDTLIKNNDALHNGGGVYNENTLQLIDSKIIENTAERKGAGLYNDGGTTQEPTIVERTLIWGNNGLDSSGSEGGGIYNSQSGVLEIRYTFIGNNESDIGGAGIQSSGSINIQSTTIADNRSESSNGSGGLLFNGPNANSAEIIDSVLANNTAAGNDLDIRGSGENDVSSLGFNLIENHLGVAFSDTDILGLNPLYDTMALIDNNLLLDINVASPIINSASSAGISESTITGTLVDATPNIGGITTNFEGGLVFWATATGDIYRSSPSFSFNQRIVTGAGVVKDIEVNSILGRVFWLDESTDKIKSAKLDGSNIQDELNVSADAVGIAIDADDQRIYVAVDDSSNSINQYHMNATPSERVAELIWNAGGNPTDIEYDDDDNTLYWSNGGVNASIEVLKRDSTNPENWENSRLLLNDNGILDNPYALAIDEINNVAYVSETDLTVVSSFDADRVPLEATSHVEGVGLLQAATYDALNGQLLLGDNTARVYSVDAALNTTLIETLPSSMLSSVFLGAAADEKMAIFDEPVELTNTGISIEEGGIVQLADDILKYTDVDSRPEQRIYTHNVSGSIDPNVGELVITVDNLPTGTFTQADIDNNRVYIRHNGEHIGTESAWTISMNFDVTDHNSGAIVSFDFEVDVSNVNDAPVYTAGVPVSVPFGTSVAVGIHNLPITDEDSDDAAVAYTIPNSSRGTFQINGSDTNSFTLSELNAERITYLHNGSGSAGSFNNPIFISDGIETVNANFVLDVTAALIAPTSGPAVEFSVQEGGEVPLDNALLGIEDADTQPSSVTISVLKAVEGEVRVNKLLVTEFNLEDLANNLVSFHHSGAENSVPSSLELVIDDGHHQVTVPTIEFTVVAVNDNDPIASNHTISGKHGDPFNSLDSVGGNNSPTNSLLYGAIDEDLPDDSLVVSNYSQPGRGTVSVDSNGEFVYTVDSAEAVDQSFQDSFTYQIRDDAGRESGIATVLIDVTALEKPVYNGTLTDITLNELDTLNHTFDANAFTSPENATPFTWLIHVDSNTLPAWLSIDESTGTLSGTPADSDTGSFELHVMVVDGKGLESEEVPITVTVTDINQAPVITSVSQSAVDENVAGQVVAVITAMDPDGADTLTYSTDDPKFEFSDNELKLLDTESLDFETDPQVDLRVSVRDNDGVEATQQITVVVSDVNEAPILQTVVPDQQIERGSVLTSMFNAYFDPDGDDLTYTLTLANGDPLPSWLVFDQAAGELSIGSTPRSEESELLKLSVDDGNGGVMQLEFTVSFVPEPQIGFASPLEEPTPLPETVDFGNEESLEEAETIVASNEESDEGTTSDLVFIDMIGNFSGISSADIDDPNSVSVSRTNVISEFLSAKREHQIGGMERNLILREAFDDSTSLNDLFSEVSQLDPEAFSAISESFKQQRELYESDIAASKGIVVSSVTLSSGLSVGYILYLLRGGAIMTSMLSSLPAWRFVDPLPILGNMESFSNSDQESLETLVANSR